MTLLGTGDYPGQVMTSSDSARPGQVRAYLDHAATTPMVPEAIAVMTEQLALGGNPSSLHASERRARRTVEEPCELIADLMGARPSESNSRTCCETLVPSPDHADLRSRDCQNDRAARVQEHMVPQWHHEADEPTCRAR